MLTRSTAFSTLAALLASFNFVNGSATCVKCSFIYSISSDWSIVEIDLSSRTATPMRAGKLTTAPYDIALTGGGNFYFASDSTLYKKDLCTGFEAPVVADIDGRTNGLCGLPDSETLLRQEHFLRRIDADTPSVETVGAGAFCGKSSGDMVYNSANGLLYTSKACSHCDGDELVRVDPKTGARVDAMGCFTLNGVPVSNINGLALDDAGQIIAGTVSDTDLFSVNLQTAELTRIPITGAYSGTHGFASFPCNVQRKQDIKMTKDFELGLTDSDATVPLRELINDDKDEIQQLYLRGNDLGLTLSASVIDLSHLDNPVQDLTFDDLKLGITGSDTSYIDLSFLAQELDIDGNELLLSASGLTVDLSPLRVVSLQATVENINGKDPFTGSRKLREDWSNHRVLPSGKGNDDVPVVAYGGDVKNGWTLMKEGRLLGFTIAADEELKPESGSLSIVLLNCSDVAAPEYLGDQMFLAPGDGRSKVLEFASPPAVEAGTVVCFEVSRNGAVDSEQKYNAASLVLWLEQ